MTGFRPGTKYIKFLSLDNYNNTSGANSFYAGIKFALSSSTIKTDNITLSEPLRCIDSILDYLDYNNQVINRRIGKKVLNGTETWSRTQYNSGPYYMYYNITNSLTGSSYKLLCSHSTYLSGQYSSSTYYGLTSWSGVSSSIMWRTDDTLANFKSWLAAQNTANTPVTIYYQLETPITESITLPMYSKQSEYTKIYITDGTMKSNNVGY